MRRPTPNRHRSTLIPFDDALEALGRNGASGTSVEEVCVSRIVGSVDRATDFDGEFRLRNESLRRRWSGLRAAMADGQELPPVSLLRLGELYFVTDGHHRISVARSLGRRWVTARVRHVCTVAYAMACLEVAHLPTKAAERRFLERVPLPEEVRSQLWLDEPAQWSRLADTAEAWGLRRVLSDARALDRFELAADWWSEEVEPVVTELREAGIGTNLRDVQLYATALAVRDRLGGSRWGSDVVAQVRGQLEPRRRWGVLSPS